MSLLKWQELANRKKELGDKINFVHDTILKNQLGEKTTQESFQKVFKPVTTKLDDVALSNLKLPKLQRKRGKKWKFPIMEFQHMMRIFLNMDQTIYLKKEYKLSKTNNQCQNHPLMKNHQRMSQRIRQMYVDPQYLLTEQQDLPPEYDQDEIPDYALDEKDRITEILEDLEITDYDNIENIINKAEMTRTQLRSSLNNKVLELAKSRRNQLKGLTSI